MVWSCILIIIQIPPRAFSWVRKCLLDYTFCSALKYPCNGSLSIYRLMYKFLSIMLVNVYLFAFHRKMSAQFTFKHFFSVFYSIHVWESYSLLWTVICLFKREMGRFRNLLIDVFCALLKGNESTVFKENLSLFYTCVKRLSANRNCHTQFENKIAALKICFWAVLGVLLFTYCWETVTLILKHFF